MSSFLTVPNQDSYWLLNVRIPLAFLDQTVEYRSPIPSLAAFPFAEKLVAAHVAIQGGQIQAIHPPQTPAPAGVPTCDLRQGLLWPCFVDLHTHLDKTQTWNRTPNPDGTFQQALKAVDDDREKYWSADDLYRRMEFGLKCSYAHGTRALRTHLDAFPGQAQTSFEVWRSLQATWAGRVDLQAVSLVSLDFWLTDEAEQMADLVAESGGILGGVAYSNPDLMAQIDRVFDLAKERELALDFHVDESLNPDEMSLRYIAQAKLRHEFSATVVCGHCCALSVQPPEVVAETLKWVKDAELTIVSLPMCNLYLQDRQANRMPRYRGVTLLPELKQQGIPVALASDNCRDPFYAYGDYDGLEVFNQSVRIGQLDRPIGDWPLAVNQTPAHAMGLSQGGSIGPDQPADLVLFKARSFNELLARPQADRVVIRQGRAIEPHLPDYAELDDLMPIHARANLGMRIE